MKISSFSSGLGEEFVCRAAVVNLPRSSLCWTDKIVLSRVQSKPYHKPYFSVMIQSLAECQLKVFYPSVDKARMITVLGLFFRTSDSFGTSLEEVEGLGP